MNERRAARTIRIAAALIDDRAGRLLLVRKAGARRFMLAGGKIEPGEAPLDALLRELDEEIGLTLSDEDARYLGRFSAPAANEPDHIVDAEIFHVRASHLPQPRAEIEAAVWVDHVEAAAMPLAPLVRDHILPLARTLCAAYEPLVVSLSKRGRSLSR
ncbi:NUDIX hydrolase [Sphingomonas lycopersici]|uniref:NUDIX hydrolase n=1 Tax=Sphingomonas lycopersici TaxID=2951807 RepID=UPI0022371093